MADHPAQWAMEQANALMNREHTQAPLKDMDEHNLLALGCYRTAFARYIEAHEEPPVDPLLIEARKLAAADARSYYEADVWCGPSRLRGEEAADVILAGEADNESIVQSRLNALRRGMELAREQSHG